jgi:preprotein translocase subunit SecD
MLRPGRPLTWSVTLEVGVASADREAVIEQTARVIETRLNALGLSSFKVKTEDNSANARIVVNLPDVPDHERVKRMITARGRLELTHVISPYSPAPVQTYNTREEATVSLGGTVPANRRVLPYAEQSSDSQAPKKWVVVESPAIVDGSDLRNATAVQYGSRAEDYQIAFSLKDAGAKKFASWTGANINQYLGVVLNDEVKSIAYIRSQISDQGEISGRFTKESAEDLAQVLRSGALPAPVRIVEEGAVR